MKHRTSIEFPPDLWKELCSAVPERKKSTFIVEAIKEKLSREAIKVLLLCGGQGTRMRPLTLTMPKPMLPLGYKPILEHIVDYFKDQGMSNFVFAVGYKARMALNKKIDLYSAGDLEKFKKAGLEVKGTIEDLLKQVDVVVDCTPEEVGAQNKQLYEKFGVKAIWQGGEEHELTGLSFNAYANFQKASGAKYLRVVSCNTTGLIRTLWPIHKEIGIEEANAFLVRRAADPAETKKGPINAIEPELEIPSHHGPDVQTVMPDLKIETIAVKVPTTLMHLHYVKVKLSKKVDEKTVLNIWKKYPRIILFSSKEGIKSTSQIMEFARDLGRTRGDLMEIAVWDKIKIVDSTLHYFQAVHQESDVVPENIDAIRAMCGIEKDGRKSVEKTDKSLNIGGPV